MRPGAETRDARARATKSEGRWGGRGGGRGAASSSDSGPSSESGVLLRLLVVDDEDHRDVAVSCCGFPFAVDATAADGPPFTPTPWPLVITHLEPS